MVDRAVLDEEVLKRAVALGAECRRPAQLTKIELVPGGQQKLTVRDADGREENILARWAVDASGVRALLARQEGWHRVNDAHPTTAVWSRWSGVKNFDGREVAAKYPEWAAACFGLRHMATNHLMGDGWWSWWIPLKGGDMSIGLVYDQRLVRLPEGPSMGERLRSFLVERHPVAKEMLADAVWQEDDVHYRKNLPYYSTTFAGDGFSLVGDAAGFIDPFYSPGLDWIAYTASATADVIAAERTGETDVPQRLARHNRDYSRAYRRWFEAIYRISTSTWAISSCSARPSCSTWVCTIFSWLRSRSETGRKCWCGRSIRCRPRRRFSISCVFTTAAWRAWRGCGGRGEHWAARMRTGVSCSGGSRSAWRAGGRSSRHSAVGRGWS